jgi:hypothetical protein
MRRPKLLRPTTDLFHQGNTLDAYQLNRVGAFNQPMYFPLRRLKTFPDHVEISWPNKSKPPTVLLVEKTRLHFGGAPRPWFICSQCSRRRAMLYVTSIDVRCRECSGLQSQYRPSL